VLQPKQIIATTKEKVLKKEPAQRMQTKNRRSQLQRYQQAVSHRFCHKKKIVNVRSISPSRD